MRVSLYLCFLSLKLTIVSQTLTAIDTLSFQYNVSTLCGNLKSEVYVGLENGEIVKVSPLGKVIEIFSYPNLGAVAKINCANPLKIFVFFEDTQQFLFLDRFSVRPNLYNVTGDLFERTDYLELSADQSLWSISSPGLELRRSMDNISTELYLLQSILNEGEDALGLHSIGNQMIIQTQNKFYIFNLAGQFLNTSTGSESTISISQNDAFWITDDKTKLYSLGRGFEGLITPGYDKGIKVDSSLLLSKDNQLHFYHIR